MKESFILVDTSVWIDVFHKSCDEKLKTSMETLLLEQKVATTALIKLELLSGALNQGEFNHLKEELDALRELQFTAEIWESASQTGFLLRRKGITIPHADLLLASTCHFYQCPLWHQDKHFDLIAKHFSLLMYSWQ